MQPLGSGPITAGPSTTLLWIAALVTGVVILLGGYYLLGRGRGSAESRLGLALGLRGLLAKELRSRSRGWRPMWLLTGYLALLSLGVTGFLALMVRAGGAISPTMGTQLFSTLAVGSVLLLAFITPALGAGAVSGERERRTLDLLLVTRASALGLMSGKLFGSLLYVLFLMAASLPAYALVYLFGGVPPLYLFMVLAVAAVTAVSYAALGLLLSALLKRTIVASVLAYLLVLALVFGLPFVSSVVAVTTQMQRGGSPQQAGLPAAYLYASPLSSVSSVLPAGSSGMGIPLVGDLMRFVLTGNPYSFAAQPTGTSMTTSLYVVATNPTTGQTETAITWAPWVYNFLFSGTLTLLCLLGATLAIAPIKPWAAWRFRRAMSNEG